MSLGKTDVDDSVGPASARLRRTTASRQSLATHRTPELTLFGCVAPGRMGSNRKSDFTTRGELDQLGAAE